MEHYSEIREHIMKKYSKYAQDIMELAKIASKSDIINPKLYEKYDVKRGLRDINGNGVVCGLTEISEIVAFGKDKDGNKIPAEGELYYRGINVRDLVAGAQGRRFAFEEATHLLLFGHLPTRSQLDRFCEILADFRSLPPSFVRDIIMKAPSRDMMNMLARCVLSLYSYDPRPDDTSKKNVLRQALQLIAQFPLLTVYSQKAYSYYHSDASLFIHKPRKDLSTAENILHMLRDDSKFTALEATVLDLCLVLHAEHGGGNNSTFTTHVVTSSGTDTYSSVAASLGSLKGPKHGGANIRVCEMFDCIKENVPDYDRGKLKDFVAKIVDKEAYDHTGLVYGMGHAVYSLSDPRADILRTFAEKLAIEKHMEESRKSGAFTRALRRTWTSIRDLYTICSICRANCTPPSLRWRASRDGRRTAWRRSPTAARSSAPATRRWQSASPISPSGRGWKRNKRDSQNLF